VTTTILDSTANNIGVQPVPPEEGVPGAGNADSIIPYLTGRSQQRMLQGGFRLQGEKVTARNNWWGGAAPAVMLNGEGGAADVSSPLPVPPKAAPPPTK
jgi:hypothetical protein